MATRWNSMAGGTNNIMKKDEEHLMQYYKSWKKTRVRRDAIQKTRLCDLSTALQDNPGYSLQNMTDELLQPIEEKTHSVVDTNVPTCTIVPMDINMTTTENTSTISQHTQQGKQRRKKCANPGCPDPNTCNGGYNKKLFALSKREKTKEEKSKGPSKLCKHMCCKRLF